MRTRRAPKARRSRKATPGIPALLPRYRVGELTSTDFLRATHSDFERMAVALMRRWDLPASVDAEDVAQELRRICMQAVEKWDAARGVDLSTFCLYVANGRASQWMNRQRGVGKDAKREQSRYPLLLIDACEREERDAMLSDAVMCGAPPPRADDALDVAEREGAARRLSVALGDTIEALTRRVERDPELRETARLILTGALRLKVGAAPCERVRVFEDEETAFVELGAEEEAAARPRGKLLKGALQ